MLIIEDLRNKSIEADFKLLLKTYTHVCVLTEGGRGRRKERTLKGGPVQCFPLGTLLPLRGTADEWAHLLSTAVSHSVGGIPTWSWKRPLRIEDWQAFLGHLRDNSPGPFRIVKPAFVQLRD